MKNYSSLDFKNDLSLNGDAFVVARHEPEDEFVRERERFILDGFTL